MSCPRFWITHLEACVKWLHGTSTLEVALWNYLSHVDLSNSPMTWGESWHDLRRVVTPWTPHPWHFWSWFEGFIHSWGVLLMIYGDFSPWRSMCPPWKIPKRLYLHTLRSLLRIYPFGGLWMLDITPWIHLLPSLRETLHSLGAFSLGSLYMWFDHLIFIVFFD